MYVDLTVLKVQDLQLTELNGVYRHAPLSEPPAQIRGVSSDDCTLYPFSY